jgi:hypothetical protein
MQKCEKFRNIEWVDVRAHNEADHRGKIWDYTKGYDVLVNADYDEVWDEEDLRRAIIEVKRSPYRAHGIEGFIHFWRSFNHVVAGCETPDGYYDECDFFRPVRLWHLREKNVSQQPDIKAKIYHFGYAIKRRKMLYKMSIHGHRNEIRPEWSDLWHNWTKENTKGHFHPTSMQIWHEIRSFDRSNLPLFMRQHPYYNRDII